MVVVGGVLGELMGWSVVELWREVRGLDRIVG